MIVLVLLVGPTMAALLVVLGGASLAQVLGPVAALALVAVVTAWVTDARHNRTPLPRVRQQRARRPLPPLPEQPVRPWHHPHLPGRRGGRTDHMTGESHGCEPAHCPRDRDVA
ncbi:hypothetical protein ABVG11_34400 [Streptomyces sp. HD1123-B1]|uniref:hypothetical protein n=1 Tax=Streptomyces huangiella TaxID=3228804 RepID=UPI003D7DE037